MTLCDSVMSIEFYSSYGTNVLENMISARAMEGKGDFSYFLGQFYAQKVTRSVHPNKAAGTPEYDPMRFLFSQSERKDVKCPRRKEAERRRLYDGALSIFAIF